MELQPKKARQRIRMEDETPRNPVILGVAVFGALALLAGGVWLTFTLLKSRTDSRLIGTWKADVDTTIAELKKNNPITPELEERIRTFFGQMTVTYSSTTVTSDWKKVVETQAYSVVRKDRDVVVIKVQSSESEISLYFDDNDTYWIVVGEYMECFRRVK